MKSWFLKCLFVVFLSLAFVVVSAQPWLVGHRGSFWGVENTEEAFVNGARKGYHLLECDVKVTADGVAVVAHDNTTNRWGGALKVGESTLAELQAESYVQTRGDVQYRGRICTLAEYLDICRQYEVRPLIELKWANGINSNDQSGIRALMALIEEKGFREECVILTSMKPCLEYIRMNYPDVELQLLAWKYSRKNLRWCKQWMIDADIHCSGVNRRVVRKYHKAGLKVNTWTINSASAYEKYAQMGCDFITTDKLF